ncbi:PilT protein domain protein [Thermaerobacter marianensis DSM 12885]|uniref:Ribonuclease VapC n=1 Tax=Thermaerobacter marianensis (strain ATCC 700841 / DSM 12885 / JCM 10246 / 7p75a) TaxID=644966 RepID=E6SHQ7_THEM7|nr:PIN domain-containing protein [Thermaerobacter marianensis]ADU50754.1 PilT protein domain protein [Thermaerobacter marianensis DSM 12885]
MKRWIVDANVLIYILGGDVRFASRARAALEEAKAAGITLYIPVAVLAEILYVLRKSPEFLYSREDVAGALLRLVRTPGVECQDQEAVIWALQRYREKEIDFVDLYAAGLAVGSGDPVLTNDDDIVKTGAPVRPL